MIDFDEIRKQVAIKHNVLLGKDDPILVTVTINEMVLDRYLDLVSAKLEASNKSLVTSLQQQIDLSKDTAGKIITDASNYVSEQLRESMADAVNTACIELKSQIATAQALSRTAVTSEHKAQLAKNRALIAAMVAGAAAVIAVVALILDFLNN